MLIVFDTCTREEYRRDVHRVLALPVGAVWRYEYKRHLFSEEAAAVLSQATSRALPIDALLMYGELNTFKRGDDDKKLPMLTWDNAKFTPTRCARITNVYVHDDVIHFHLQMRGYLDPSCAAIEQLIRELQQRNQLPFGDRTQQYCWVSVLPEPLRNVEATLASDDDAPWSKIVERMFRADTQFRGDIFWRILNVVEDREAGPYTLPLRNRSTNRFGMEAWYRDYSLHDQSRYNIRYQTYDPSSYGEIVPGNAKIALIPNDSEELIRVPVDPAQLRQNQVSSTGFTVRTVSFLGSRYASIEVETQLAGEDALNRDPGSRCTLTVRMSKSPVRAVLSGVFGLFAASSGVVAAALKDQLGARVALGIATAIAAFIAYYLWTGKTRVDK
jgi:hypothetical protein